MKKLIKKMKGFQKDNIESTLPLMWEIAVGAMFLILLCAAVFGYYLFLKTNADPDTSPTAGGALVDTVKDSSIDKVLQYFKTREQKSLNILSSPAPVIDPSL